MGLGTTEGLSAERNDGRGLEDMTAPVKTFTIARRHEGVSHEDLVARWRSTHAANVMQHMRPDGYALTFFEPRDGKTPYDGMAELRYDDPNRARLVTGGNIPTAVSDDGWSDLVQLPNTWLRVTEHVIVAGPSGTAATKVEREDAFKLTFLISPRDGVDPEEVKQHWLDVHVPNFRERFVASGGVRYVVNIADRVEGADLVGLAELSYRDRASAEDHRPPDDGFRGMIVLRAFPSREIVVTVASAGSPSAGS
jgi:hypothetical protein